jgi:DNA invertase Pin-like site-specific DNA recombinase
MKYAVPYYRVSSKQQGKSGLGLAAQKKSVRAFAGANKLKLLHEFTEVESGKNNKRPVLLNALEECKSNNAILIIAKLDRLGRNVAFISHLMESGVDFIAVDNPHANKLIVHIMAAFAEFERDQASARTKEALQAAKRKGTKLGTYSKVLSKKNKKDSWDFALKMRPVINKLNKEGIETIREIMNSLNERKIATVTGKGQWHVNTVYRLLKKISLLKKHHKH